MIKREGAGACPYCGNIGSYKAARDADFVQCIPCGVLRPSRQISASDAQRMLESQYTATFPLTPILDCQGSEIWGGPSPEQAEMLRKNCPDLLAGGRALDVGAGLGDFVSCLSHLGMRASGLEAFARSAATGRQHGLDIREGRFDLHTMNEQFSNEKFDLISSVESLYYLNLRDAINLVRRWLAPNGAFYIKTLVAGSPYYWRGAKLFDRLGRWVCCFYTASTIISILQREQFEIDSVRYVPMSAPLASRGWAIPPWSAARAEVLFRFLLPSDRVHILARKAAN